MRFLTALEWAFGAFLVVFVVWQIAVPMLLGYPPFSLFREKEKETTNDTVTGSSKEPNDQGKQV